VAGVDDAWLFSECNRSNGASNITRCQQPLLLLPQGRHYEDPVLPHDRRGMSFAGYWRFPCDVLRIAPRRWGVLLKAGPIPSWPSPHRPVLGTGRHQEREDECGNQVCSHSLRLTPMVDIASGTWALRTRLPFLYYLPEYQVECKAGVDTIADPSRIRFLYRDGPARNKARIPQDCIWRFVPVASGRANHPRLWPCQTRASR